MNITLYGRNSFVVLWLVLWCINAHAQTQSDSTAQAPFDFAQDRQLAQPLTVDDAVALAIKQNPRLSAATRKVIATRAGVRSARALANPSIVFTPGVTSIAGSDEELLVQQPLELNGTRGARTAVARAQLRQTHAMALVELRNLVFDTKVAYYELARAQELRSLAQDVLRTTEELDRGVRRQVDEGLRPGVDQIQTGVEVSRARQQLTLAESQVIIAQSTLNTLMARPPRDQIESLPRLPFEPVTMDRETALQRTLEARAEITVEEALRQEFFQVARLARAEGRPDIAPQFRAESVTRGFGPHGLALGITLPILDYGSRRNRIRQAEASANAQEARIAAVRNQVQQEVEQSLSRLRAAENVIRNYQQGVLEQSRSLLDATLKGFQLGAPGSSLLTILEAQRTYRLVQTEYTNALVAHAGARAELERATGSIPASLLPITGNRNK